MKHILIIGTTFPEPSTTAAGLRMIQLIKVLNKNSFKVSFATQAIETLYSYELQDLNVGKIKISVNDSSFDTTFKSLNPDVVIFDRFIMEEQFGWRIKKLLPNCIQIIDTEDLHLLRKAREKSFNEDSNLNDSDLYSETAIREISSILRSDLALIISKYEYDLLKSKFDIKPEKILYLPFLLEKVNLKQKSYSSRNNFVSIGNFLHSPNINSFRELTLNIWDNIKEEIPKAELHIFGAYSEKFIQHFHKPKKGVFLKGWTENLNKTLSSYKVCLAPIRFGAGLKGKIINSFENGTPCVTTSIGAEGIDSIYNFGGFICDDNRSFIKKSVELYKDENIWKEKHYNCNNILQKEFDSSLFENQFISRLKYLLRNFKTKQSQDFHQKMLNFQTLRSQEFMSRWIEEKNKTKL